MGETFRRDPKTEVLWTPKVPSLLKGLKLEERPRFSSISMIIMLSKFNSEFQWVRYAYNFIGSIRFDLPTTEPLKY